MYLGKKSTSQGNPLPGSSKREAEDNPENPYKKYKGNNEKFGYTGSENEVNNVFDAGDFDAVFVWKIPNVTSLPCEYDYIVHSPPFSYEGAIWVLKICPYGESGDNAEGFSSQGFLGLKIERLYSEFEKHVINAKIYCGNPFKEVFKELKERFTFDSNSCEKTLRKFMQNPRIMQGPRKWLFAPDDTLTLLVAFSIFSKSEEIVSKKCRVSESTGDEKLGVRTRNQCKKSTKGFSDDLGKTCTANNCNRSQNSGLIKTYIRNKNTEVYFNNLGKPCTANKCTRSEEIGEISNDGFNLSCFYCKVCKIKSSYFYDHLKSPLLFIANATWVLKVYPYFKMLSPESRKQSFDVVLERLHSEVPEHYVILQISVDFPIEIYGTGSFFFNAHHTHTNVITFKLNEEANLKHSSEKKISEYNCLHFNVNMYVKTNAKAGKDTLTKIPESYAIGDSLLGSLVHPKNKILLDYKQLYQAQEGCDVTFRVKGQEFPAHRMILKARSPEFASTFEKTNGVINVKDCNPSIFSDFLTFLYCGELQKLSQDNVFNLFIVADKYNVLDLKTICMEFIKQNITIDSFCDTLALTIKYPDAELIKLSSDFFAKNLQEIIVTTKWQSCITENPLHCNELMIKALVPNRKEK